jgi:uncharacterized protein YggE
MEFPVKTKGALVGVLSALTLAVGAVACTSASGTLTNNTPTGGAFAATGANTFQMPEYAPTADRTASALGQPVYGQTEGIIVNGVGRVSVTPDLALIRLGVEAQAEDVAAAREQAATAMQAIIDALKEAGVADDDIQTQYFNVQPIYHWEEQVTSEGYRGGRQVLDGYRVTNSVVAKVRDLSKVGEAIDGAIVAGGDVARVDSISFTLEDSSAAEAEARKLATQNAVTHAQQIAEAAGVSLGKPISISEAGGYYPVIKSFAEEAYARGASMDFAEMPPTPIQAGELEVVVTVQAVFGIG